MVFSLVLKHVSDYVNSKEAIIAFYTELKSIMIVSNMSYPEFLGLGLFSKFYQKSGRKIYFRPLF